MSNRDSSAEAELRLLEAEQTAHHMHPLELIPLFRRWPCTVGRDIVYTIIFSTTIGLVLVLVSMMTHRFRSGAELAEALWDNLVVSNIIGFTFHLSYHVLGPVLRRMNRLPFTGLVASYTVLSTVMVQIGAFAASLIPGYEPIRIWMGSAQWFASTLVVSFVISLIMSLAWQAKFAALTRAAEIARERERLEAAERAAAEANLRALQAQIEPHFLFNTLANVVSLIDPAPDKSREMLQDFIQYLRASLAATRAQTSTLGREAELMRAFLRIIKIRMGERLEFTVDIADELLEIPFPPMLLQPLIENAIKHGLESKMEGGQVVVRARRDGDAIEMTVEDTGLGFQGDAQSGVGLSNVRERLLTLYGASANLSVEGREPSGTRIKFRVPITSAGNP